MGGALVHGPAALARQPQGLERTPSVAKAQARPTQGLVEGLLGKLGPKDAQPQPSKLAHGDPQAIG